MATKRVLIVDQFSGVSPYGLQLRPISFDELIAEVVADEQTHPPFRRARVVEIDADTFRPEWGTTVLTADDHGRAVVFGYSWDSSG